MLGGGFNPVELPTRETRWKTKQEGTLSDDFLRFVICSRPKKGDLLIPTLPMFRLQPQTRLFQPSLLASLAAERFIGNVGRNREA